MGNTATVLCFCPVAASTVKLISYGGATTVITGKHLAGELMFQFPDSMVCHADSFFIGHPVPALAIDDELITGQTYFLLPLNCFKQTMLSVSTLAALASDRSKDRASPVRLPDRPFEYRKGSDGRVSIKVSPEYIANLIMRDAPDRIEGGDGGGGRSGLLCSTLELQTHYDNLVGCRGQTWSPKLETICEDRFRFRFSPSRLIGLERKK